MNKVNALLAAFATYVGYTTFVDELLLNEVASQHNVTSKALAAMLDGEDAEVAANF